MRVLVRLSDATTYAGTCIYRNANGAGAGGSNVFLASNVCPTAATEVCVAPGRKRAETKLEKVVRSVLSFHSPCVREG